MSNDRKFLPFIRFSLGTLMLVTCLLAVGFGWLRQVGESQRTAVKQLRGLGAEVYYEWEEEGGKRKGPGPSDFEERVGIDCFYHVELVVVFRKDSDKALALLQQLDGLERVKLAHGIDAQKVKEHLPRVKVDQMIQGEARRRFGTDYTHRYDEPAGAGTTTGR